MEGNGRKLIAMKESMLGNVTKYIRMKEYEYKRKQKSSELQAKCKKIM